ncbi:MAG: hypothetical protein HND39_15645 [Ignavibacteriota bacterium]|jgi:hypothetical protein|nr:MAG: hypothetical protein EDM72_08735 [Chlorobiota bacterium]MBE7477834.1 hypothetical protein [Ignavibacteriales bacterium]MBL1124546.1 hypothetical protein [Ignavibacteriota bacterium]MBV6419268.1 hypothetical protein [Ignavibacteriaceae bacterium]MCE7858077.1 hypothetical protein [Ignavibacteria bacterium CHB3]
MDTITIKRRELKKLIRETFEDVLSDRKDLISEALLEAMEDIGLAKAIESGRTGQFVDTKEFKERLTSRIKRIK